MASHDPTTPPSTPVTRRALALGAGAFSAIGITAGAAASATIVRDSDNGDAELIRLCREHAAAEAIYRQATDQQAPLAGDPNSDAEWNRLDDIVTEASLRIGDLEEQIESLPARTPEGIRAKAEAMLAGLTYGRGELGDQGRLRPGAILAQSLARDLLGRA